MIGADRQIQTTRAPREVPPAPIVPPAIEIFEPVYKVLNVAVPVPDIVILPVMERLPPAEAVPTETVEL